MNTIITPQKLFFLAIIIIAGLHTNSQAQTVTTNAQDYPPGSTVIITGSGFNPFDTVTLQVLHNPTCCDDSIAAEHFPWKVIADSNGHFITSWYVEPTGDLLGADLILTAVGTNGTAIATFTDGPAPPPCSTCLSTGIPNNTGAVVDGNAGEWNLSLTGPDFWDGMYTQGSIYKTRTANAFVRYSCNPSNDSAVVYVLVYTSNETLYPLDANADDNWASINVFSNKLYVGNLGNNGVPPDFQFIGLGYDGNSGHVKGYEASFLIPSNQLYSCFVIHTNAFVSGMRNTSATPTFSNEGKCLNLLCSDPDTSFLIPYSISCPGGITDLGCTGTIPPPDFNALTITPGNCVIPGYSISYADANPVNTGGCIWTFSRTYTITDSCGASASCSRTYLYSTANAPAFDNNLPLGGDLGCNPVRPSVASGVTATNACGIFSATGTAGPIISTGGCGFSQKFYYSATASCGGTSNATVTYTWTETGTTAFNNLPAGGNLGCDPVRPSVATGVTATNACGSYPATGTAGPIVSTGGCGFSQIFYYSATANCGGIATATVTYTWKESSALAFNNLPSGGYLGCNPVRPSVVIGVTATNTCGTFIAGGIAGPITSTGGCGLSQTIQYFVTASCGGSISANVTYTWTESTAPRFNNLPAGGNLGCNPARPSVITGVTASNSCGSIPATGTAGQIVSTGGCGFSQTFQYTATAICGGSVSANVTYTWTESGNTVFNNLPSGGNLGCNPVRPSVVTGVTATNACGSYAAAGSAGQIISTGGCGFSQTFRYTATASCGSPMYADVTYTWTESTAPQFNNLPAGGNLGCNPVRPSVVTGVTATNACGSYAAAGTAGPVNSTGGCGFSQNFSYTATAGCGGSVSAVVTYTWTESNTLPVFDNLPSGGNLGCNPVRPAVAAGITATNSCGTYAATGSAGQIISTGGCGLSQTFHYTATASCGGSVAADVTYTWTESGNHSFNNLPAGGDLGCDPPLPVVETGITASNACGTYPATGTAGPIITIGANGFSQTFHYTATAGCGGTLSASVTYTWEECSQLDPPPPSDCRWCNKGAVLNMVEGAYGNSCVIPDIVVDVRLPKVPVDPLQVGTGYPATGSIQAAINYVNTYGDPSPGDGQILIGVTSSDCVSTPLCGDPYSRNPGGDNPYAVENIVVTNLNPQQLNILGCSQSIHPNDPSIPVITIQNSVGPVLVGDLHVKNSSVEGYLVKNGNAGLVTIRNGRVMNNDIGIRVQDNNVLITSIPEMSGNRIGVWMEGGNSTINTISNARNNFEVAVKVTGNSNNISKVAAATSGMPNGTGILVTGSNNTISENNAGYSTANGIEVTGTGNFLDRNNTSYNRSNGILADMLSGASQTRIAGCTANGNTLQGILACGQVDGGGNSASGNLVSPQITFDCSMADAPVNAEKFITVDISSDKSFRYDANFNLLSSSPAGTGNGDASDICWVGSYYYVVDKADKAIYRYGGSGMVKSRVLKDPAGSNLSNPGGLAMPGDQVWIADGGKKRLYLYNQADAFIGSTVLRASMQVVFNSLQGSAEGLFTDGTYLYVLDNSKKRIFRYLRTSPYSSVGSRTLKNSAGAIPGNLMGAVLEAGNVWIVDNGKDKAYRYSLADLFTGTGNILAQAEYPLNIANANATGIAIIGTQPLQRTAQATPAAEKDKGSVTVYPNPFIDQIRFRVTPAQSGKATLQLFDMQGRLLDISFEGYLQQGVPVNITVPVRESMRTPMMYLLIQGDNRFKGKLIPMK